MSGVRPGFKVFIGFDNNPVPVVMAGVPALSSPSQTCRPSCVPHGCTARARVVLCEGRAHLQEGLRAHGHILRDHVVHARNEARSWPAGEGHDRRRAPAGRKGWRARGRARQGICRRSRRGVPCLTSPELRRSRTCSKGPSTRSSICCPRSFCPSSTCSSPRESSRASSSS